VGSAHYPRVLSYAANVVVIVMGVAGAGKTTIGRALAAEFGWRFVEGDELHTAAAVEKMRAAIPLTDADRESWIAALHLIIAAATNRRERLILSCSALKERYRQALRGDLRGVRFVYLEADPETLGQRLASRAGHFAGPALLPSQLATLEPPAGAITIDGTQPPDQIVRTIRRELGI
jgi:carbohydrate kinase (thermoresistant glucokinase family)